jgi:hypothetical protein
VKSQVAIARCGNFPAERAEVPACSPQAVFSGYRVEADSDQKRWVELDGLRGLAALLVLYAHLFLIWMPGTRAL